MIQCRRFILTLFLKNVDFVQSVDLQTLLTMRCFIFYKSEIPRDGFYAGLRQFVSV